MAEPTPKAMEKPLLFLLEWAMERTDPETSKRLARHFTDLTEAIAEREQERLQEAK